MKLSIEQMEENVKKFGKQNLKVPEKEARERMISVAGSLSSDRFSTREKIDYFIRNHEETNTYDLTIIKCPTPMSGAAQKLIRDSEISFSSDHSRDLLHIWIPFAEWDKLGDDFEETYKKYIDWELIKRYSKYGKAFPMKPGRPIQHGPHKHA